MKKALIIANMMFASATVLGMMPDDLGQGFSNKRNFSQIRENREGEDQSTKREKISDLRNNVQNGTLNRMYIPQPIPIYDVRRDGSRFVRALQQQPRTSRQFRYSVLNLGQSSRLFHVDPLKKLQKSFESFYGNVSQLQYIQTHSLINVINKFTSGNIKTLEKFRHQNPLLVVFMRRNLTELSHHDYGALLRLGGTFSSLRKLEIEAGHVEELPLESLSFPVLKELKIEISPKCFSKANDLISKVSSTLQKLEIISTNIEEIPSVIGNCRNLTYLDLHENWELRQLPESIKNCKELRYLDISNTGLSNIPDEIFELKKLEHLDFSCNDYDRGDLMTRLSSKIGNLTNLKWFALTGQTDLRYLPSQIWDLKNLETLILECNGFRSLPKEIGKLEKLVHLDLSICDLETLPPEIGNLGNLKYLNLDRNPLRSLPKEIGKLKNLVDLDLGEVYDLKTLPPEIGNLRNLESLTVYSEEIRSLPYEIWNLTKLKTVHLDDKVSVRQFIGIEDDETIMLETESLDMSNAGITDLSEFPIDIIGFKNAKKIDLSRNEYFDSIDKIPDLVFTLPKLESVILSANLSAIPEIARIEDGVQANRFNVRYKNPKEAGQIKVLAKESDGKYRVEYTPDTLMKAINERIRKINGKIDRTCEEINTNVLNYLLAYKNRFKMDNNHLKKLVKKYQIKNREIEEKLDHLCNLVDRLTLNGEWETESDSDEE